MKIVSRKELMEMPKGTIYSNYSPCIFNGLNILSGSGGGSDFVYCDLLEDFEGYESSDVWQDICEKMESGNDVPMRFGDAYTREGLFDDSMKYAVWSKEDVKGLIKILSSTL